MPYKLSVGHLTVFLCQIFSVIFVSCSVLIFSLPASISWVTFISFHRAMSPHHSVLLIFLMLFSDHIIIIQSLSNSLLMPIRFNHCCKMCLHISASKTCPGVSNAVVLVSRRFVGARFLLVNVGETVRGYGNSIATSKRHNPPPTLLPLQTLGFTLPSVITAQIYQDDIDGAWLFRIRRIKMWLSSCLNISTIIIDAIVFNIVTYFLQIWFTTTMQQPGTDHKGGLRFAPSSARTSLSISSSSHPQPMIYQT